MKRKTKLKHTHASTHTHKNKKKTIDNVAFQEQPFKIQHNSGG